MKTILLAEDDPFIVDIYATQFRKAGYRVDVAMDGQSALQKVRQNHPDLLVLDINLPKLNGWEVLKTLRSESATENTRVIVVSNNNPEVHVNDIAQFKVIKYFLKVQTTIEEILKTVQEILN